MLAETAPAETAPVETAPAGTVPVGMAPVGTVPVGMAPAGTVPAGMAVGIESSSPSDGHGRLLVSCNSCSMSLGLWL